MKNTKLWILKERKSEDLIEQILLNRDIPKKDWDNFLNPNFNSGLHDPFKLSDMEKAVQRIKRAILEKEIVGIFGDYDADGIPASALLSNALEKYYGLKTITYIPSRKEGYGLNKQGIDFLKKQGVSLLITCDLGIREVADTEYSRGQGIDVIITDHHEPGNEIPKAIAVIDPKRKASKYPFRELSGGGVVFKLLQALAKKLGKISENDLKWMLDLVGITTICDVVPLIDENRILAKFGLVVLQKTKNLGLRKLYQAAAISPENIDTYSVSFQIGPRLNAPGRMDHANESFYLLRSQEPEEAKKLAEKLNKINQTRQAELDRILKEARTKVIDGNLHRKKVIFVVGDWPSGLVGLVAGKITEEFARPSLVFEKGSKFSKGSARSVDGFDLVEALEESKNILENYGGHSKAAGMTVLNEKLSKLYDKLLVIAEHKLKEKDLVPRIKIDAFVEESDLKLSVLEKIKKLEPFGLGNPRPVLAMKNIAAQNVRTIGNENKHLRFDINNIKVIGFDWGWAKEIVENKKIDLAFTLDEDNWDGVRKVELKVVDIKLSGRRF